ncbi:hypothetical protein VCV18_001818 [Metarhizium anisopliae]
MADDAITYRSAVRHGTSAPHCGLAPKALQVVMSNPPPPFIIGSSGTLGAASPRNSPPLPVVPTRATKATCLTLLSM